MKTYARIESGRVVEIIAPMAYEIDSPEGVEPAFKKGDDVPIDRRFTPDFVATLVDIGTATVGVGDKYLNGSFAPYTQPPPTAAEILARNTAMRDGLLANATAQIAPLQDAVDLDMATTDEIAALKLWKQYRVAVNRIELTSAAPAWPPQPG